MLVWHGGGVAAGGLGGLGGGGGFRQRVQRGGGGMDFGGFGGGGFGGGGGFPSQGFPGGATQQQRRRPRETPDCIPAGTRVTIKNLKSAAHHNGDDGQVLGFDASRGRYHVRTEDGDLKIKRENVQQIIQGVEVRGLESKKELNGSMGTLFDFDEANGRYSVHLNHVRSAMALKPQNVILPKGTNVIIGGLVKGTHFNGRSGTVTDIDRVAQRYVVQMSESEHVRVRFDKCRA